MSSEQGVKVTEEPLFDWNCVAQDFTDRIIIKTKNNGATCPPRCSQLKDCDNCLTSQVSAVTLTVHYFVALRSYLPFHVL